jgi:hypothetical protein
MVLLSLCRFGLSRDSFSQPQHAENLLAAHKSSDDLDNSALGRYFSVQ